MTPEEIIARNKAAGIGIYGSQSPTDVGFTNREAYLNLNTNLANLLQRQNAAFLDYAKGGYSGDLSAYNAATTAYKNAIAGLTPEQRQGLNLTYSPYATIDSSGYKLSGQEAYDINKFLGGSTPTPLSTSPTSADPNIIQPMLGTKSGRDAQGNPIFQPGIPGAPIQNQPGVQTPTIPVSTYTGPSIVDYLASVGQPSDYASRVKLAAQLGIRNYTGSATQNTDMLKMLRAKTGSPTGGAPIAGAGAGTPGVGGGTGGGTPSAGADTTTTDDFMAKVESILAKYGIKTPDPSKDPVASFQDSYKELFKSLGLDTVKKNIEDTIAKLSEVDKELNDKIAEVGFNPWLSQSERDRRISSLQSKYENRRGNIANELKLYEALYDNGRDEARFITGQAMTLIGKQESLTQDLVFKAIERAEKELDAMQKLDTEIVDVNGEKQLINKKTGEVIRSLGRSTSPTSDKGPASYQEWVLAGSPGTFAEWIAKTGRPPTQAQETVATYAARLEQSNPTLIDLTDDISKMNPINFETQTRLPSFLQSSEIQQYMQAARNFINATLRRESGAVISDSEFDNAYKQYLPKPGDSEATLIQKRQNRDVVQASFKKGAGPAYQSVDELLGVTNNDPLGIR